MWLEAECQCRGCEQAKLMITWGPPATKWLSWARDRGPGLLWRPCLLLTEIKRAMHSRSHMVPASWIRQRWLRRLRYPYGLSPGCNAPLSAQAWWELGMTPAHECPQLKIEGTEGEQQRSGPVFWPCGFWAVLASSHVFLLEEEGQQSSRKGHLVWSNRMTRQHSTLYGMNQKCFN